MTLYGINTEDLYSVKRGFNRLWFAFQHSKPPDQTKLLDLAEFIRTKLEGETYAWKMALKRIDWVLDQMRKVT